MQASAFTTATQRILKHAGCGAILRSDHGRLFCPAHRCYLTDPAEIAKHDPQELPTARPAYGAVARTEAWA